MSARSWLSDAASLGTGGIIGESAEPDDERYEHELFWRALIDPVDAALRLAMAVVLLLSALVIAGWFWWAVLT